MSMSITPTTFFGRPKKQESFQKQIGQIKKIQAMQSSQFTQNMNFSIKNVVDETDPTVAWKYDVPIMIQNQKSISVTTGTLQMILINFVGNNFPQKISIGFDNVQGYYNASGQQTTKIMALNLTKIMTKQSQGMVSRDLVYTTFDQNLWDLGQLRSLTARVYTDDQTTPVTLPLSNSINVSFKIVHIGF